MLDSFIRPYINPPLRQIGERAFESGLTANMVTVVGFIIGMIGCVAIGLQAYSVGLVLLLINRFLDGLDGAISHHGTRTDFGAYIDTIMDYTVYGAFALFFAMGSPIHALATSFLLFSLIGIASTSLGLVAMKLKAQSASSPLNTGPRSQYMMSGLVGDAEIIIFIILACFFPVAFSALAAILGVMCWITTVGRILEAKNLLG